MFDYFYGAESEKFLFYQVPIPLVKERRFSKLSTEAKLLYGILLGKTRFSARNGWVDDKGRVYVYYTVKEAKEDFGCASEKAVKIFHELATIGLIEKKRQPNKPTLIYVKNFDSGIVEPDGRNFENRKTGISKIESPEFRKSKSIYKENINKEIINNPSIYLAGGEKEEKEEEDGWIDRIRDQIDYEALRDSYGVRESHLDFLVDVIVDSCEKGNGSKFEDLNMFDILYVLESLETSKPKVKNIRGYITKCLENAHRSRDLYYTMKIREEIEK